MGTGPFSERKKTVTYRGQKIKKRGLAPFIRCKIFKTGKKQDLTPFLKSKT